MTTIGGIPFGDLLAPIAAACELATALDRLDRDPSCGSQDTGDLLDCASSVIDSMELALRLLRVACDDPEEQRELFNEWQSQMRAMTVALRYALGGGSARRGY